MAEVRSLVKQEDNRSIEKGGHYIETVHAVAENIRILFEALNNSLRWLEDIRERIKEM